MKNCFFAFILSMSLQHSAAFADELSDLRERAEQGDAGAQTMLGYKYYIGDGVPEGDKEALKWFRLAAEQGFAKAQYNLGNMYKYGDGVPEDDREAIKWHRLAAEQGFAKAQNNLGVMYK